MATRYCPCFCEENVWHLCTDDAVSDGGSPVPLEERSAVFITNDRRRVAMRKQRAGGAPSGFVGWDYHVVLLARRRIWDLDSTLEFPTPLDRWVQETFHPLVPGFEPRFRVVDAPTYLSTFASDRSHMRGADGRPMKPLPPWPPIGKGMTLPRFIDLAAPFVGKVLDLDEFRRS